MLKDDNDIMIEQILTLYPEVIVITFDIDNYIKKIYDKNILKYELMYLAVHIHSLQLIK